MEISINQLPESQIEITGEMPAGDFELYYQKAIKKISGETSMPGFRPGNIPEDILLSKTGESAVLQEAAELALQSAYLKILEEHKIDAIGKPEILITKIARNNPLGFKIKTAVMPEFSLPDYKSIAKKVMAENSAQTEVSEKELEGALEYLRKMRSLSKEKAEGEKNVSEEPALAELNDEFAKGLGKFETLEELKKTLRENILFEKQMKAKEARREKILSEISLQAPIEVPEILIEFQKQKMENSLRESLERAKIKWADYLERIKKSEEALKKDWQKEAETRVRYGLILDKIAVLENIKISEDELSEKAKEISAHYNAEHNEKIDEMTIKEYAYSIIRNEKIFKLLEIEEVDPVR